MICGIRRTDHKTSATGLLNQMNLQPLAQHRGKRRLNIFSNYDHTNKAVLSKYIIKTTQSLATKRREQYFISLTNTDHCKPSTLLRPPAA